VYRITISLESSTFTPGSSRRSSITEGEVTNLATTTFHEPTEVKDGSISLSISYITYSASWSPRYDLNLNSIKSTGVLEYGADLKNTTSETWRDAKVILSTSQTTFSGLSEEIPTLYPWHVRLIKAFRNTHSDLMSQNELEMKRKEWNSNANQSQKPRNLLFGIDNSEQKQFAEEHKQRHILKVQERGERLDQLVTRAESHARRSHQPFGILSSASASQAAPAGGLFGGGGLGSLFGASRAVGPHPSAAQAAGNEQQVEAEESDKDMGFALFDDRPTLSHQDENSLLFEGKCSRSLLLSFRLFRGCET
jgi:hypothetical protein